MNIKERLSAYARAQVTYDDGLYWRDTPDPSEPLIADITALVEATNALIDVVENECDQIVFRMNDAIVAAYAALEAFEDSK